MVRLLPVADSAVLLEIDDEPATPRRNVDVPTAPAGLAIDEGTATSRLLGIEAELYRLAPSGLVTAIVGLRSLLAVFDPCQTTEEDIAAALGRAAEAPPRPLTAATSHLLPLCATPATGWDLEEVVRRLGTTIDALLADLVRRPLRVAAIGHLPGLPYLVGLPPTYALPRQPTPRPRVPAGAVALAAGMACVYPVEAPGGWWIVGRTPARLFDPDRSPPALLSPGDEVRFSLVSEAEFQRLWAERESPPASPATPRGTPAGGDDEAATVLGPVLRVLAPGLHTTVQDLGRRGTERFGVSPSGAADPEALRLANLLVGNTQGAPALEVTHVGPLLEVDASSVRIAVVGECEVTAEGAGSPRTVPPWQAIVLRRGERLRVARVGGRALRAVVAVAGGLALPPVLGSRSTDLRGGLGPLGGRPLRTGDLLPLRHDTAPEGGLETIDPPAWWSDPGPIRVVFGPHCDRLPSEALDRLLAETFTVSPMSDRTGLRLASPPLPGAAADDLPSFGCVPGMIQLPSGGQLVVLGPEAGTMGGYPVLATVASVDLPRLGRLRPGAPIRFAAVDVGEARRLRRDREAEMAALAAAAQSAVRSPPPDRGAP